MEMHQIRYFLAVCEKNNFTQAAQLTYVSQPSLTQAIKKLEQELGGELFIRHRSGCELTALGRLIEPNLRHMYQQAQTTKAKAIRFTRLKKYPVRIGLMTTIGAQRLGPFFARFQHDFHNTELELIVDSESNLFKKLQSNLLDLIITAPLLMPGKNYHSQLLYDERYGVVFNKNHRFNQLKKITLTEIQEEAYLDRLNCELRETLKTICRDHEISLYATYRSNNEEWILNMARAGIGVALIPEYTLPLNASDVGFNYLQEPAITRQIYAIYKPHAVNQELEALINCFSQGF